MADEAEDMYDDAKEADMATDASHIASSDTKQEPGRSEKHLHVNANGTEDTEQEVAMKSVKVKKRKAVIDDSDDD